MTTVWNLVTRGQIPHPTSIQQVACPHPISKSTQHTMALQILFTHNFFKFSRSCRFSPIYPLPPITLLDLQELAGRIRLEWERSISKFTTGRPGLAAGGEPRPGIPNPAAASYPRQAPSLHDFTPFSSLNELDRDLYPEDATLEPVNSPPLTTPIPPHSTVIGETPNVWEDLAAKLLNVCWMCHVAIFEKVENDAGIKISNRQIKQAINYTFRGQRTLSNSGKLFGKFNMLCVNGVNTFCKLHNDQKNSSICRLVLPCFARASQPCQFLISSDLDFKQAILGQIVTGLLSLTSRLLSSDHILFHDKNWVSKQVPVKLEERYSLIWFNQASVEWIVLREFYLGRLTFQDEEEKKKKLAEIRKKMTLD
ncbi:hypothetical protein T439DRAFT_371372 [Meredithblackwellia eburnea MCA 4105]